MITRDEATLLSEVRLEVAETVGISIAVRTPDQTLERYEQLLASKAAKQIATPKLTGQMALI